MENESTYLHRLIDKGEKLLSHPELEKAETSRAWFASVDRFRASTEGLNRVAWLEFEDALDEQIGSDAAPTTRVSATLSAIREALVPAFGTGFTEQAESAQPLAPIPVARSNAAPGSILEALSFSDVENVKVSDILEGNRSLQKFTGTYLDKLVNEKLPAFLEERFGELSARLTATLDFVPRDLIVDGAELRFPGGTYSVSFRSHDKKSGELVHQVRFESQREMAIDDFRRVLSTLGRDPTALEVELSKRIDPMDVLDRLQMSPWQITSQLPNKVLARHVGGCLLQILPDSVGFSSFSDIELWGDAPQSANGSLIGGMLNALR